MKKVSSKDPRKPALVAALKAAAGGATRISDVRANSNQAVGYALNYIPATGKYTEPTLVSVKLPLEG